MEDTMLTDRQNPRRSIPTETLGSFCAEFGKIPALRELLERVNVAPGAEVRDEIRIAGLAGSARAFLIQTLFSELSRSILCITADIEDAYSLAQDLERLPAGERVFNFPSHSTAPYEFSQPTGEILGRRISALAALQSGAPVIVVAPLIALCEPTVEPQRLREETLRLRVDEEIPLEELTARLVSLGYRRVGNVEEVGDFSQRGGLIDFFSPGEIQPVRVEYLGDTIETIRTFEVSDQRTRNILKEISLLPRREAPYDLANVEAFLETVGSAEEELLRTRFVNDPELPGLEWIAPLFGVNQGHLLDFIGDDTLVLTDHKSRLLGEAKDIINRFDTKRGAVESKIPSLQNSVSCYQIPERLFSSGADFTLIDTLPFRGTDKSVIDIGCKEPPPVGGQLEELGSVLSSYRASEVKYIIAADNLGQAERITELIHEKIPGADPPVIVGLFQGGFFSPIGRVALLTDHEIFKRQYRRRRRKRFKEGVALTSYASLDPGDHIVHTEHGVARFLRLETILVDKRHRDCLLLQYANDDRLFVPIEEFNRVSKYSGKNARPSLSRLGGAAWEKLKSRAKKGVEEIAERLVRLYAERLAHPGFAFKSDSSWMRQLEASFPYEETEDQQKAIDEVKRDMEDSSAMDRLVCGDVGFGKTEVAVRAALKCIEEGRQVAVLVPTTILAQQHYMTFTERLTEFPVQVEMMSRFRTRAELNGIEEKLRAGSVDVLIGTHRILNKKVVFRDLGLLVVDEEQRFGVRNKERLRELKINVDTITLTATPIPRTLQMSLAGARDMTLITSSPRGRLPITTVVSEFSAEIVAEAILREVDRGGQVFFVHNRVQTIDAIKNYLYRLLPQVSVLVAHGQLAEKKLESVMLQFVQRKAQVLLCTSIIESGLDIPSVNTILIDRADRFGMAQLYQLRGRVGRSTEQAYCYLLTPGYRRMTEDARRRLKAIEAHTELGSGFALAMRDLEIRGAGNMLGAKQSGFIDEIGFDMYTKLLEEAVSELKGDHLARLPDTTLESDIEIYLPEDYININQHKVDFYRRLAQATSPAQVERIREELVDRYGKLPQASANLIQATALKLVAAQLGIEKVKIKSGRVELHYETKKQFGRPEIERMRLAIECPMEFIFSPHAQVTIDESGVTENERIAYTLKALEETLE